MIFILECNTRDSWGITEAIKQLLFSDTSQWNAALLRKSTVLDKMAPSHVLVGCVTDISNDFV